MGSSMGINHGKLGLLYFERFMQTTLLVSNQTLKWFSNSCLKRYLKRCLKWFLKLCYNCVEKVFEKVSGNCDNSKVSDHLLTVYVKNNLLKA